MSELQDLSDELQECFAEADIAIELAISSGDEDSLEEAKDLVLDCLHLIREYSSEVFRNSQQTG